MYGFPALCRDCGGTAEAVQSRCRFCGSPRLLSHPERDTLTVAHVDCDAFFAAVEKRDDPALRDKPVIVGGGKRGVVATACYVARTYGVHSAMPMFKALKACPGAVVVRPDIEKYGRVGREVRRLMRDLTPLVEPVSIDEAFLDLSGTERLHRASPAETVARFARRIEDEIGITVSVGLSYNKFLAKVASDRSKPRSFSIIGQDEAEGVLADQPLGIIPGLGGSTRARLAEIGVTLVRHLRDVPQDSLAIVLGRDAPRLAALARGEDPRPVRPERAAKSLSAETTFEADLRSCADLRPILWRLAERVSLRLKRSDLAARGVTLKLKDAAFRLRTRTRSGLPPTQLASRLFEPAQAMLHEACDGAAFRLIGIGASDLCDAAEADRGDLADTAARRDAEREAAIDRLREKFGPTAVQMGLAFRPAQR